ncbi:methyl-accepting chemotaxis protein [Pelosinus sp. sgz500959]|uniref:methyl-accepting chemotaxis protein n=1 Tax=Pelosinus sp. sgz500959 TaxID=3242472 RepID=UPI00366B6A9F
MKRTFDTTSEISYFSRFSIKAKLILFTVSLTLLAIVATLVPALYLLTEYNNNVATEQVKESMNGLTTTLEDYKKNSLNFGAVIASHPGVIKGIKTKDADTVLQEIVPLLKRANIDFATITDETGKVIVRTHEKTKGDSVVNQANVKNALTGTAFAAIESGTAVKFSARAGTPVKDEQGKIIGVISAGYYISNDKVVDRVKENFGTDVTLFLDDTRVATTIIKDGQRALGTKLSENVATKVLKEGEQYIGKADILGAHYITQYAPLIGPENKPIGALFVGKNVESLTTARNKIAMVIGGISFFVMLIVIILATIISNKITQPIRKLATAIGWVASGDLSKSVEISTKDEIGLLANGYNTMIEQLKNLITNVNSSAETLTSASKALTTSGNYSAQASQQVASAIAELANGAELQRSSVEETSTVIEQISTDIQQVATNAHHVALTTQKTIVTSKEGSQSVENAVSQMNTIEIAVENSAIMVTKLGERSKEISGIIDTISGISKQTNLLALNAAIEAARAGEQGRGFAIVAEEVRKLAEQSQESAKQIAHLIGEIQNDTDKAVIAMNDGTREVRIGAQVVTAAGKSFHDIADLIMDVSNQVNQISAASQQMANGSQQIVTSINKINEVSAEAAGQTQNVSSITEEQSASIEEIASSSQALAKMAEDLTHAVNKFKT